MLKYNLSPSTLHRHLMNNMTQSLSYNGGDFTQWQQQLKSKLEELIGDMPTEKCPLNVKSLWKRKHEYGTVEKVVFTSEPYADVPAYMCIPHHISAPYKTFICLQGHSTGMHNSVALDFASNTQPIEVKGDRDFGLICMRYGIAALCIEQRSFGERQENMQEMKSDHTCHDAVCHSLMLGRTLAGERVWDVERALDYLESRGDIAVDKIGLMGNSGGGTITIYAAALLDRIALAMPSCSFCTFRDSIMSIYHCADNYIPGLLKYAEAADIAGLIAPKPLVIVAGREDVIFPVSGVEEAFADLKKIYRAAGAEEKCKLVIGAEGHRFYAEDAWPVMLDMINQ